MPLVSKISFASVALLVLAACSPSPEVAPPVLVSSPTPLPAETIARYRSDLRNTGVFALDSAPLLGELAWRFETGGEVHASPVFADGVLYAASYDELLYAIDAQSGAQLWQAGLPERTDSSPLVTQDSIYIGTLAGLMVFDLQTGALRFGVPNVGYVRSSPLVLNGTIYFGSDDGHLYALDAATGDQKWAFPAESRISSSPAIWEERIIFGDESGMLYALDAATGAELWRFPTEQPIFSSPAVSAAGVVYFGGLDGAFYALQAFSGDLFWRWVAEGPEEELLETETPAAAPSPTPEITPTFVPEVGTPIVSSAAVVEVENMV
jgi:outer membrane protein assembly factor BamB